MFLEGTQRVSVVYFLLIFTVGITGQSPTITQDPTNQTTVLGETATFSCGFNFATLPVWRTSDNTFINQGSSVEGFTSTGSTNISELQVGGAASLNLTCVSCGYQLTGNSNLFSEEACLLIIGPPLPPGIAVVDRTLTTITVGWSQPYSHPSYPVEFYEFDFNGGATNIVERTASRSATFTGLPHDTSFNFRIRANNSVGFSDYAMMQVSTESPLVPPPPANIRSVVRFANNAVQEVTVMWDEPLLNGSHTNISGYRFSSKLEMPGAPGDFPVPTALASNVSSYSLSGVTPGQKYIARVQTTNSAGHSDYSTITVEAVYLQAASCTTPPEMAVCTCELAFSDRTDLVCQISIPNLSAYKTAIASGTPPTASVTISSLRPNTYNIAVTVLETANNQRVDQGNARFTLTVPATPPSSGALVSSCISSFVLLLLGILALGLLRV